MIAAAARGEVRREAGEEEGGLFKAKAVNEEDAGRDRATSAWVARSADTQLSAVLRFCELTT